MSFHIPSASRYGHAHHYTGLQRIKVEKVEKLTREAVWVGEHSYDNYRFTLHCPEIGKSYVMTMLYSWDDYEWCARSASCGVEFPIELRAEGIFVASRCSPFDCHTVSA